MQSKAMLFNKSFAQPEIFFNPLRSTNLYIKALLALLAFLTFLTFLTFRANHSLKKKAKTVCVFRLVNFKIVNIRAMKPL